MARDLPVARQLIALALGGKPLPGLRLFDISSPGARLCVTALLICTVWLAGCAVQPPAVASGMARLPGGAAEFDWGMSQRKENFENIERAQSSYGLYRTQRAWENVSPGRRAAATIIGLRVYSPLSVRWRLKDGREYLLEDIDIAAIMRDYFKTHDIQLPWQREKRPKARVGDANPMLAYEVKDDTVRLKWVITTNHTPVDQRLTPQGAANRWETSDEEYLVAVIQGKPTAGIDFDHWWEFRK